VSGMSTHEKVSGGEISLNRKFVEMMKLLNSIEKDNKCSSM